MTNQEIKAKPVLTPVVTIRREEDEHGTWRALMTVSGLRDESQAEFAMYMMQQIFCADEIKVDA